MPQDISNIDDGLFKAGIFHITDNPYVQKTQDQPLKFQLNPDWRKYSSEEMMTGKFPFQIFWIRFPLGIEYLAKGTLLKHKVNIFKDKKKEGQKTNIIHPRSDDVVAVRDEYESGMQIMFSKTKWLQDFIEERNIKYSGQLNSGTIGDLYNGKFAELLVKGIISEAELDLLNKNMKHLANHRRNSNLHCYYNSSTFISNNDLPDLYIPLVNSLCEIYTRS